jgi:hypothetical protein
MLASCSVTFSREFCRTGKIAGCAEINHNLTNKFREDMAAKSS